MPLEVMHYQMPVLGFRIDDFAYITDAKTVSNATKEKLTGLKVLVINALQKESHISHLTLEEAIEFAQEIGAEQTYLTHIGHRMGLHQDVSQELPQYIHLAYDQLEIEL
ncbi:putative hydrolase [compost metagenome]